MIRTGHIGYYRNNRENTVLLDTGILEKAKLLNPLPYLLPSY